MLELNGLCNGCAIKLQFETYYVGQFAGKIMFKMTYITGNLNFTCTCICLIYAGYVYVLHVHSNVIRDFLFDDNDFFLKISYYISMLQKNLNF